MSARTTPGRIAVTVTAVALLGALLAPGAAVADDPAVGAAAEPVVNGGLVTDTNYLGPDGTVRVLPIDQSTLPVRVFSPDGGSLAHVKEPSTPDGVNELWILEADGDERKVVDLPDAPVYDLAWSRDGASIVAMSAYFRPSRGETRSFLHVVDVATGTTMPLVDTTWDRNVSFRGVAWSADGQRIALSVSDEDNEAQACSGSPRRTGR